MNTSTESERDTRIVAQILPPPPPRLEDTRKNFSKVHNAPECMDFCVILENIILEINTYDFAPSTEKNQYSFNAYAMQDEAGTLYVSLKKAGMEAE
ncbi:hypothetical protein TNCT_324721 [Trichonephila clavata]|uniref:Uncharacterized protein n=1 Tax=Trichonephila clavata TaxID=2740835 RepID=A0A8X6JAJ0_TRICU|nr:hypothetical protein TNCT_324721 [Trichonephila clavata]